MTAKLLFSKSNRVKDNYVDKTNRKGMQVCVANLFCASRGVAGFLHPKKFFFSFFFQMRFD